MAIDLLSPSPAAPRYCGIPPRELRLELQELRLELRCRTWTAAPRCGVPMMGVIKCYKMVEVFTSYNHYKPTFCPDPIKRSPVSIIFPWKTLKNQSGWTPKKSYSSAEINLSEHLNQIVGMIQICLKNKGWTADGHWNRLRNDFLNQGFLGHDPNSASFTVRLGRDI